MTRDRSAAARDDSAPGRASLTGSEDGGDPVADVAAQRDAAASAAAQQRAVDTAYDRGVWTYRGYDRGWELSR